jgi:hypothetical protein
MREKGFGRGREGGIIFYYCDENEGRKTMNSTTVVT